MAGKYYRIKRLRRRGVNRFTADTYDAVCGDISWANVEPGNSKNLIVKHAKNKMAAVAELVKEVLKFNSVSVLSYGKYASTNVKTRFRFNSREDASKAQGIINKMALPDTVNRSAVNTDGTTTTTNGVKIKVDVDRDANGNTSLREGTTYIATNQSGKSVSSDETSGINKWLVIGGAAVLAVIAVLAIIKISKKK